MGRRSSQLLAYFTNTVHWVMSDLLTCLINTSTGYEQPVSYRTLPMCPFTMAGAVFSLWQLECTSAPFWTTVPTPNGLVGFQHSGAIWPGLLQLKHKTFFWGASLLFLLEVFLASGMSWSLLPFFQLWFPCPPLDLCLSPVWAQTFRSVGPTHEWASSNRSAASASWFNVSYCLLARKITSSFLYVFITCFLMTASSRFHRCVESPPCGSIFQK